MPGVLPRQHGLLPGPPHTVLLHHLGNYRILRPHAGSNVPSTNGGVLPRLHQRQRQFTSRHKVWRVLAAHRSGLLSLVLLHDGDGTAAVFQGNSHQSPLSGLSLSHLSLPFTHSVVLNLKSSSEIFTTYVKKQIVEIHAQVLLML